MNDKLTDPPAREGQMAGPRLRVGKILERIALHANAITKLGQNPSSQHLFTSGSCLLVYKDYLQKGEGGAVNES